MPINNGTPYKKISILARASGSHVHQIQLQGAGPFELPVLTECVCTVESEPDQFVIQMRTGEDQTMYIPILNCAAGTLRDLIVQVARRVDQPKQTIR